MFIKRIGVLFVIITVLLMAVYVFAEEIMTNETVVKMVKAKLGDSLIIGKIKTSKTNFDLSTDALISLKGTGVSEKVIEAMIGGGAVENTVKTTIPNQLSPASGIPQQKQGQIFISRDGQLIALKYTKYEFVVSGGSVAKNVFKQMFSFGFAGYGSADTILHIAGIKSDMRLTDAKPIFYIYDDPSAKNVTVDIPLAKLDYNDNKNMRYAINRGRKLNSSEMLKVNVKEKIEVLYEKAEDGLVKITPNEALQPGEYAFISGGRFYDFGIDGETKATQKADAASKQE